jgi:hypothetical protein
VFSNLPNPSSRTMALGSTQPLTEMSTRNLPGGKERPAHKVDNLTAICEPIVYKMWEPLRLTTVWASTHCYRDSFTFFMRCDVIFKQTATQPYSLQNNGRKKYPNNGTVKMTDSSASKDERKKQPQLLLPVRHSCILGTGPRPYPY